MAARRLLAALLPLALALLVAHRAPPGSALHAQLAPWPAGQRMLERAHEASAAAAGAVAGAAQRAQRSAERLLAAARAAERLLAEARGAPAGVPQSVLDSADSIDSPTCHLQGAVDDCCNCTYAAVHEINERHVHPVVSELVKTAFFRYFKVNIYCDCPLWPDDSMCSLRACSVCECEEGEVPKPWLAAERGFRAPAGGDCHGARQPDCNTADCAIEMESQVDQTLEPGMKKKLRHLKGWRGINNPWMADGDGDEEYLYINLLNNPERYTGYKGEHAHRIWSAIYDTIACARDAAGECAEARVFYRLVSGMHSSISTHLSAYWLLDEEKGSWGPNMEEFERRLGTPEAAERVSNLHFAYLLVLRAVVKAGPLLAGFDYDTGLRDEDRATRELVKSLLANPAMLQSCPLPFDEARLWKGQHGAALKAQLQGAFKNITRIMDCVGCEKCKLWGKLQTLGVATALKILFASHDCAAPAPGAPAPPPPPPSEDLSLERNEAIALVNLLARFSNSLHLHRELSARLGGAAAAVFPQDSALQPSARGAP
ncbi:hypothetical protein Rsub_02283 [Raphidocelis subcapitata]|uniref:Uncharacterized protein n=1 Tax=Raphidocelis subcapitata TaxID=307507 RepID=A0A2V0NXL3_9CHLO|nr:hypothetical protein Rsub_02283 [Raphidocelis subcapitata]|eukprot:GBF89565.1 hypothetical protein Rsub_02283 [Raphidocelis subcapitata]